jgi:hypothetical protein
VVLLGGFGAGRSHLLIRLGLARLASKARRARYVTTAVQPALKAADERILSAGRRRYGRLGASC